MGCAGRSTDRASRTTSRAWWYWRPGASEASSWRCATSAGSGAGEAPCRSIMMRLGRHHDATRARMRTTVTLADDVAAAVDRLRREEGLGLSEAVNKLARAGLTA